MMCVEIHQSLTRLIRPTTHASFFGAFVFLVFGGFFFFFLVGSYFYFLGGVGGGVFCGWGFGFVCIQL